MPISRIAKGRGLHNSHAIADFAFSLGGKRVDGGWVRLPHLCGGKMAVDPIGNGELKINVESGGVFCHYRCSHEVATHAVYDADVTVNTGYGYRY